MDHWIKSAWRYYEHFYFQRENFKKYLETNENENMMVQKPRDTAKAAVRGKYSHTGLPQEKKVSNEQPKLTPRWGRERKATAQN